MELTKVEYLGCEIQVEKDEGGMWDCTVFTDEEETWFGFVFESKEDAIECGKKEVRGYRAYVEETEDF